ncbi:MAG: anion transporter, partial [Pseudomonadota bacterium]
MTDASSKAATIGRWLGPLLFVAFLATADVQTVMSVTAWRAAALSLWMAIWWATEAVPVPVTALL